jgi:hypothetical protein
LPASDPRNENEKERTMARKMIAALQVSLDGFTQGSDQGGTE